MNEYQITKITKSYITVIFNNGYKKTIRNLTNLNEALGKVHNNFKPLIEASKFLLTDDQYNLIMKTYCPNKRQRDETNCFVKEFDSWYENQDNINYLNRLEDKMVNDNGFLSNSCF